MLSGLRPQPGHQPSRVAFGVGLCLALAAQPSRAEMSKLRCAMILLMGKGSASASLWEPTAPLRFSVPRLSERTRKLIAEHGVSASSVELEAAKPRPEVVSYDRELNQLRGLEALA